VESDFDVHHFEFVADGEVSYLCSSIQGGEIKIGILGEDFLGLKGEKAVSGEKEYCRLVSETGTFGDEAGALQGLESLLRCFFAAVEE